MSKNFWRKALKASIHSPGIGTAIIVLTLTQIPEAIKTAAEIACIGEISHQQWKASKSHRGVNVVAVQQCNGNQ